MSGVSNVSPSGMMWPKHGSSLHDQVSAHLLRAFRIQLLKLRAASWFIGTRLCSHGSHGVVRNAANIGAKSRSTCSSTVGAAISEVVLVRERIMNVSRTSG